MEKSVQALLRLRQLAAPFSRTAPTSPQSHALLMRLPKHFPPAAKKLGVAADAGRSNPG
jgi:hypothetical protein